MLKIRSTFLVSNSTSLYPRVRVDQSASGVVSHAGGVMVTETVRRAGLDRALSQALLPWCLDGAVHDPGKVLLDLAIGLALGGDCLADVAVLRAEPAVFGPVASDPTVSRTVDRLAADAGRVLAAINSAISVVRQRVWAMAGEASPVHSASADAPVVIDLDATLVTSHSDKQQAAPTYKRGFGFHPLLAFIDHGPGGTGEPVAGLLRAGNAGANTAADHLVVIRDALAQLPFGPRPGRKVLIRTDGAGGTREVLTWLTARRLQYSVGFGLNPRHVAAIQALPDQAWTPAYNADGVQRDGAWVADVTGVLDLTSWPPGMRVLVRAERPHPGAQLRFTDLDGNRLTALATNTPRGQLADLELRHRRRARCEDVSGPRKTPDYETSRCMTSPKTGSGWRSCSSPASSPAGCKCSPWQAPKHAPGNQNAYGYACFRSPAASPDDPAEYTCSCRRTHPGAA